MAAAFGRLCVETEWFEPSMANMVGAAAFGRLCVETIGAKMAIYDRDAAAFGRLCVETVLFLKEKF